MDLLWRRSQDEAADNVAPAEAVMVVGGGPVLVEAPVVKVPIRLEGGVGAQFQVHGRKLHTRAQPFGQRLKPKRQPRTELPKLQPRIQPIKMPHQS